MTTNQVFELCSSLNSYSRNLFTEREVIWIWLSSFFLPTLYCQIFSAWKNSVLHNRHISRIWWPKLKFQPQTLFIGRQLTATKPNVICNNAFYWRGGTREVLSYDFLPLHFQNYLQRVAEKKYRGRQRVPLYLKRLYITLWLSQYH